MTSFLGGAKRFEQQPQFNGGIFHQAAAVLSSTSGGTTSSNRVQLRALARTLASTRGKTRTNYRVFWG